MMSPSFKEAASLYVRNSLVDVSSDVDDGNDGFDDWVDLMSQAYSPVRKLLIMIGTCSESIIYDGADVCCTSDPMYPLILERYSELVHARLHDYIDRAEPSEFKDIVQFIPDIAQNDADECSLSHRSPPRGRRKRQRASRPHGEKRSRVHSSARG